MVVIDKGVSGITEIGRKDLIWNYLATFLRIASSVLLLPAILNKMPAEMVGVWTVFITISFLTSLLDFGFNASFTRNVSYVLSGVTDLRVRGYEQAPQGRPTDYGLLKGLIQAMRWYYKGMAVLVAFLSLTIGTWYLHSVLKTYQGDTTEVYIAWGILIVLNSYSLYTFYYDSLLQGVGYVMRSKQISIAGNASYLVLAFVLIMLGYGLIAIVSAQLVSVVLIRVLSYRTFFRKERVEQLRTATARPSRDLIRILMPNAVKIGLTSLGGFLISRSSVLIGGLFLTLDELASWGITLQLIGVVATMAGIYTATYQARIVNLRVGNRPEEIRRIYIRGQYLLLLTFAAGAVAIVWLGPWALGLIRSETTLMPAVFTLLAIFVSLLETNHATAGNILLTKNEVPFFKASLISGAVIVAGLLLGFHFTEWGIYTMVIVPLIVDVAYQSWKWPLEAHRDLGIKGSDYFKKRGASRND